MDKKGIARPKKDPYSSSSQEDEHNQTKKIKNLPVNKKQSKTEEKEKSPSPKNKIVIKQDTKTPPKNDAAHQVKNKKTINSILEVKPAKEKVANETKTTKAKISKSLEKTKTNNKVNSSEKKKLHEEKIIENETGNLKEL